MVGAEHHEVLQRGLPAARPVADVMALEEAAVLASGEAATAVARGEGAAGRGRDRSPPAPHRQGTLGPVEHRHQGALAAEAPRRLGGDPRAGLEVAAPARLGLVGERRRVDVDDHLVALAAPRLGPLAAEEGLGDRGERVGAPGAGLAWRFRGTATIEGLGGLQRLEKSGADLGRQPSGDLQAAVLVPAVREVAALLRVEGRLGGEAAPVLAHHPVELRRGGVAGQLDQLFLGLGLGDPGDRPHLGVGELAPPEGSPQVRQLEKPPRHPHVLARRARIERALPGDPRPAGMKAPALMGSATI